MEHEIPIGITTIGRDADNLIQLNDSTVSRHHVKLVCVAGECDLTDLNSSNGTFVNNKKIAAQVPASLKHQDRIRLGPNYEMVLLQIETTEEKLPEEEPQALPSEETPEPVEIAPSEETPPPAPPAVPEPPLPPPDGAGEMIPPGLSIDSRFLLKYLPGIYHTERMSRFLGIFEAILMPIDWTIDNFDQFLSPRSTPSGFLSWLANWFGAEFDNSWGDTQKRQFLEDAWLLYARRGTKWALSRVLEIYTGKRPEIDDLADDLRPHTFRVTLDLKEKSTNRASIETLIDSYKPAHTDYELYFKG